MLGESLEKFDRRLFVAALVGAALSLGVLLRDDLLVKFLKKRGKGEVIGRVVSTKNDVRRRLNQSLTWYEAFDNEAVEERDSLFTGSDSELTVELLGNQQLSIDANSLVVMHTKGDEILLDLQLGSVASFAKTEQTIKVMTDGQVTTIKADKKAAPVLIKKNPKGSLTILSRTGDVEVGVGDKKAKVKQNEAMTVDRAFTAAKAPEPAVPVEPVKPKIEEPGDLQGPPKPPPLAQGVRPVPEKPAQKVTLKFKDGVDVRSPASVSKSLLNPPALEWKPVENANEYALEISADEKFESPLIYDPLGSVDMVWKDVKPGAYFWRVKARGFHDDESLPSEPAKLTVELSPPKLSIPVLNDETIAQPDLFDQEREVEVKWTEIPMAKGYRFMANIDGKAEENTVMKSPVASLNVPPNKTVELKVAAVDEKGRPISPFSEETLSFKRELQVKAPKILLPNDQTVIVAFDKKRIAPLLFTWGGEGGASGYEIQFSADPGFKNVIVEKTVKSNQFLLKERFSDAETYWRVRSRFKTHKSAWSDPRVFRLQSAGG